MTRLGRIDPGSVSYECSLCGARFTTLALLGHHMSITHRGANMGDK